IEAPELAARMRKVDVSVIDVRGRTERAAGRLPGVPNIPLGYLPDRLDEAPADPPLGVQCPGGGRSAIAASRLKAQGYDNVINLQGGFNQWQAAGHPVER